MQVLDWQDIRNHAYASAVTITHGKIEQAEDIAQDVCIKLIRRPTTDTEAHQRMPVLVRQTWIDTWRRDTRRGQVAYYGIEAVTDKLGLDSITSREEFLDLEQELTTEEKTLFNTVFFGVGTRGKGIAVRVKAARDRLSSRKVAEQCLAHYAL